MIPKPFKECKYCRFNDHHSDHCEFYHECEVCGTIAHEPSDCPKKHPDSMRPRIANMQSEPTKKWVHKRTNPCKNVCVGLPQEESGPKVVFRDDSSGDTEGNMENLNEVRVKELRSDNGTEFRNHKLEEFCDEKVAKAFRVFNIRRQKMEETVHATFSENDEVISQTSTEDYGYSISVNIEYFPYVSTSENITLAVLPTLQNSVTSEEPLEFTEADNHPTLIKQIKQSQTDLLISAEPQKQLNLLLVSQPEAGSETQMLPQLLNVSMSTFSLK
ncbi:hypothetical protein Tco_0403350 [Tanacetum coccineum]